jgi:hypothetical protein
MDPFPLRLSRRSAGLLWSLAGAAMAMAAQAGQRGCGPRALSQWMWVILTPCKMEFPSLFHFRKMLELVKIIVNYPFVGKLRMTYQNAQKNMLYMFMSIFMQYKQL